MQRQLWVWVSIVAFAGCSGEQSESPDSGSTGRDSDDVAISDAGQGPDSSVTTDMRQSLDADPPDSSDEPDLPAPDAGPDMPQGGCDFTEDFDAPDGSDWPAPWAVSGGVATADVQGGRARLQPTLSDYSLARMVAPLAGCVNAEATLSFEFSEAGTEGIGLYLRHNGGYLAQSNPTGQGYAAFAEAFRDPVGLGLWREVNGDEQNLPPVVPFAIAPGTVYRMRLQVEQTAANETTLRGRIWADGDPEPPTWTITRTDSSPGLQGQAGDLVLDAWSSRTSGTPAEVFIDDVVVSPL